jgi:signal transduction histidine kinase
VEGFEVQLRRADGTDVWLSLNVHSVLDDHGRIVAREGSVVDLTAAKLLELERTRLATEIVRALEAERAAIAEDVHDDPVQKMTAVGQRLEMLKAALEGTEHEAALARLAEDVRTAIGRLRRLIFDLHPSTLERRGLAEALHELARTMAAEWAFEIELRGALEREPPPEVAIVLYRVTQEALANVARHARASRVTVAIENVDSSVRVAVQDDGVGFDPAAAAEPRPGHLGLAAMRERIRLLGGRWAIRSTPGGGTTVEFVVPLDPAA